MENTLLRLEGLCTSFWMDGRLVPVVDNVSFSIRKGEMLALVGESGSGKSVTSKTILRLIADPPGRVTGGKIWFDGQDLLKLDMREMRKVRGNRISMIFQEPMASLNPVFTCGSQIMETLRLHQGLGKKQAREKGIEMLRMVGIQMPEKRFDAYPHELSGGMCQRAMIAMALACSPDLLIADEPTTALDPTIQAQIIELIKSLQKELGMTVLYITHDLGVVAGSCERVIVMYAGAIMEQAEVHALFQTPLHPYTQGLLQAMPRVNHKVERLYTIEGIVPPFQDLPKGCPFAPRCLQKVPRCQQEKPPLVELGGGRQVRCWLHVTGEREG